MVGLIDVSVYLQLIAFPQRRASMHLIRVVSGELHHAVHAGAHRIYRLRSSRRMWALVLDMYRSTTRSRHTTGADPDVFPVRIDRE
ncbi:hypothetical protein A5696_17140 [Mycobacterium sp. E2699]|nr:hypothetical protein A5696_17140 [Mycobacterium sp. E2699]OBI54525.1 hypothetical protein A5705_26045 [Mycobacterium sp. E787]